MKHNKNGTAITLKFPNATVASIFFSPGSSVEKRKKKLDSFGGTHRFLDYA